MPERRQAYSALLTAVDRWQDLDFEAAVRGEVEEWFEAPPEDRLEPITGVHVSPRIRPRAHAAAATAFERLTDVHLVGSSSIRPLAQALCEQMRELSSVRYHAPPKDCGGPVPEHDAASDRFSFARDSFIDAVRTELGSD